MHANLFRNGATEEEVYQALQRDSKRDSATIGLMDLAVVLAGLYLLRDLPLWDAVAAFVVVFFALRRLNFFIDQSNRNFFMHWLDWEGSRTAPTRCP